MLKTFPSGAGLHPVSLVTDLANPKATQYNNISIRRRTPSCVPLLLNLPIQKSSNIIIFNNHFGT